MITSARCEKESFWAFGPTMFTLTAGIAEPRHFRFTPHVGLTNTLSVSTRSDFLKPWKFLGFPNSLYRDVIKDPKNFQCLGSLGDKIQTQLSKALSLT